MLPRPPTTEPDLAAYTVINRVAGRCIVTAHRPDNERIVITGMGVASCFGNDVDTFYDS